MRLIITIFFLVLLILSSCRDQSNLGVDIKKDPCYGLNAQECSNRENCMQIKNPTSCDAETGACTPDMSGEYVGCMSNPDMNGEYK